MQSIFQPRSAFRGPFKASGGLSAFPPLTPGTIALVSVGVTTIDVSTTSPTGGSGGVYEMNWHINDLETGWTILDGATFSPLVPGTLYTIYAEYRENGTTSPVVQSNTLNVPLFAPPASVIAWLQPTTGNTYTDAPPGSVLAANTDLIRTVGDPYSLGYLATQATSGDRPTQQSNGAQFNTTSAVLGVCDAAAGAESLVFTGEFTFYFAGLRNSAGQNWVPMASVAGTAGMGIFADDAAYIINDAGAFISTPISQTGTVLVRVRRDGSNNVHLTITGSAEVNVGSRSGTLTMDAIGARPVSSQWNGSTSNRHGVQVFSDSNLTPGGADDLAIRAQLEEINAGYVL